MAGRRRRWTDAELTDAVGRSLSIAGVLKLLGLVPAGGNYTTVRSAVHRLGCDASHWLGRGWRRGQSTPGTSWRTLADILVQHSTYTNRGHLEKVPPQVRHAGVLLCVVWATRVVRQLPGLGARPHQRR